MAPLVSVFADIKNIEYGFETPRAKTPDDLSRCHQVHESGVVVVDTQSTEVLSHIRADGLFTQRSTRSIGIQTADCLPVLMCSRSGSHIAAIHAGWRGLDKGILLEAVKMFESKNVTPDMIRVAIGPAIGACCFETMPEVAQTFKKNWNEILKGASGAFFQNQPKTSKNPDHQAKATQTNSIWIDLKIIAVLQLMAKGIIGENIQDIDICTYCSNSGFESYRRAGHQGIRAGRQWSWIKKIS